MLKMCKLNIFIASLCLFFTQAQAACTSVVESNWDMSAGNPPTLQRPVHTGSTPEQIHTTGVRTIQTLFQCADGNRNYYARLTNTLGGAVSTLLYRLPGIQNLSIAMDVKDPDANAQWVSLYPTAQRTVTYNSHVGLHSRLRFYATGPFQPGTYPVARTKVGEVWGELVSDPTDKSPIVSLYIPAMIITVNNYGCTLSVPSNVALSTDVEQSTTFNVTISQCGGTVNAFARFSDPDARTVTKSALPNKGTAKGYELKLQTSANAPINFIPIGTTVRAGEISLGSITSTQTRTTSFSALLSRTTDEVRPGTLQFATTVGIVYR